MGLRFTSSFLFLDRDTVGGNMYNLFFRFRKTEKTFLHVRYKHTQQMIDVRQNAFI